MGGKQNWKILAAAGGLALAATGAAWGDGGKFEEAIKYRRSAMTMIKWHGDRIAPLVKNAQAFNREEVLRNAAALESLSRLSLEGFPPGSHEGDTKALPEIWKNWDRFKGLGERFQAEAAKLRDMARTAEPAALKAQLGEMNKACKACHDDFKSSKLL